MARIRMIKPEFFDDPDVGDLPIAARLLFLGLLTQADRRGRLKDDAKRLRARLLPYDTTTDAEPLLAALHNAGFIVRYVDDGRAYVQIRSFEKHQRPHPKEAESEIPPAPGYREVVDPLDQARSEHVGGGVYAIRVNHQVKIGHSRELAVRTRELLGMLPHAVLVWVIDGLTKTQAMQAERAVHQLFQAHHVDAEWFTANDVTLSCPRDKVELGREKALPSNEKVRPSKSDPNSGFLILDSGIRNPPPAGDERDEQFTRFWAVYPAKKGKKAAWQEWRKLRPSDELAEQIIAAVQVQVRWPDWLRDGGQYIPNPSTWLHQGRWDDEPKRGVRQAGGATPMPVSTWECLHNPPCDAGTTAFRCNQRTVLEQGRQKTA